MISKSMRIKNKYNFFIINGTLIVLVVGLAILPLFIEKDAQFGGADGIAEEAITEIDGDYKPWFSNIWEPPSVEIESLLFALQASIGTGILGYGIGYLRGKSKKEER